MDSRGCHMRNRSGRTSRSRYRVIRSIDSGCQSRFMRRSLSLAGLSRRLRSLWFPSLSVESVYNSSLQKFLCGRIFRYRFQSSVRLSRARCSVDSSNRPRVRFVLGAILPRSQINLLQSLGAVGRNMGRSSSIFGGSLFRFVVAVGVVEKPSSRP